MRGSRCDSWQVQPVFEEGSPSYLMYLFKYLASFLHLSHQSGSSGRPAEPEDHGEELAEAVHIELQLPLAKDGDGLVGGPGVAEVAAGVGDGGEEVVHPVGKLVEEDQVEEQVHPSMKVKHH